MSIKRCDLAIQINAIFVTLIWIISVIFSLSLSFCDISSQLFVSGWPASDERRWNLQCEKKIIANAQESRTSNSSLLPHHLYCCYYTPHCAHNHVLELNWWMFEFETESIQLSLLCCSLKFKFMLGANAFVRTNFLFLSFPSLCCLHV